MINVIKYSPNCVHGMRNDGENAIKRQILVHKEEEIAPIWIKAWENIS